MHLPSLPGEGPALPELPGSDPPPLDDPTGLLDPVPEGGGPDPDPGTGDGGGGDPGGADPGSESGTGPSPGAGPSGPPVGGPDAEGGPAGAGLEDVADDPIWGDGDPDLSGVMPADDAAHPSGDAAPRDEGTARTDARGPPLALVAFLVLLTGGAVGLVLSAVRAPRGP